MAFTAADITLIYDELRRRVRALQFEGSLTGTALANEALLKCLGMERLPEFETKRAFIAYFIRVVRSIQIDRWDRRTMAAEHLADLGAILRDECAREPAEIMALHDRLGELRADPYLKNRERIAQAVELHHLGGMSIAEAAEFIDGGVSGEPVTVSTVKNDLAFFAAWLSSRIQSDRVEVEQALVALEKSGDPESLREARAARLHVLECRPTNLVARAMKIGAAEVKTLTERFITRMKAEAT